MKRVRRGRSGQGKAEEEEEKSPEKEGTSDSDSDDVDKSIVAPVRGGRGGKAKQQQPAAVTKKTPKAPPKRTTRSSKAQLEKSNEEESATSQNVFSSDDSNSSQEEEEDKEDKPPPKGSKGKQPVAQKKGKKNDKAPQAKDNSFEFAVPADPVPKKAPKKAAASALKLKATKKDANVSSSPRSLNTTSSSTTSSQRTALSDSSQLSSTTTTTGDLTKAEKKEIHSIVLDCLDECQKLDFYGRRRLYNRFRAEFYKMKNPEVIQNWQKYFTQSFWTICLVYFKAPNCEPVKTALKFIHQVALNMGTPNDKAEVGFKPRTHPMYYYILKLFLQCHMEERHLVRLRVIDIAHEILKKFASDALIKENSTLKKQLIDVFLERIKDRNQNVRAVAASCLKFYAKDPDHCREVIKRLKYSGRYDPFPEPRKVALVALADNNLVKLRFFYDAIFDSEVRVRIEAFACLANRPMAHLKAEENLKAVLWGLSQEDRCKKVVVEKLIPAWFDQCNKNPLELINRLCAGKKFKIVEKILDGVFPNNYVETFEKIDVSFLDEHHVIPIDKLTVETVMFWIYLIKKFGKDRIIQSRLLPKTDYIMEYIRTIVNAIHEEHEKAVQEDRDEDGTLILCLTYIISATLKMGLEEGNRRNMKEILRNILLDSILDEAPLVKLAVDGMHQISDKSSFHETMIEILQLIFEPDSDQTMMDGRESRVNQTKRTASWAEGQESEPRLLTQDQEMNEEYIAEQQASKSSSPMHVEEILEQKEDSPPKPTKKPLTEKQIMQLKDKKCGLAIQRIRLQDKKQKAVEQTDFLEAHRIQKEIEVIVAEENQIEAKMSNSNVTMNSSKQSVSSKGSSRRGGFMNNTSDMEMEIEEEPAAIVGPGLESLHLSKRSIATAKSKNETLQGREEDLSFSQASAAGGVVRISFQNILKGLVMMNRYLSCRPKIAPLIRQFYTEHAPDIFLDCERDPMVRIEVLTFLCYIALIDPEEKRKLMGLFIAALINEEDLDVKAAAFKVIVDVLCKYDIQQFILKEDGIICAGVPEVYNKLRASTVEMQTMFMSLIDDFGSPRSSCPPKELSIKVEGIIKLLTSGCLASEHLISELLCIWTDVDNRGTDIPYNIEIWLPLYTKTSAINAKLVVKALFMSILQLVQQINERSTNAREQSEPDFMKLLAFVSHYISSSHLMKNNGTSVNLHEELYEIILDHVLVRPTVTTNVSLLLVLPKLSVESKAAARDLLTKMSHILLKLTAFPQTATVTGIKSSIEKTGKRLAARYDGLEDILDVKRAQVDDSDDEEDENVAAGRQHGVFSDDEEELEEEKVNVGGPQTNNAISEDDMIRQSSDVEIEISPFDE